MFFSMEIQDWENQEIALISAAILKITDSLPLMTLMDMVREIYAILATPAALSFDLPRMAILPLLIKREIYYLQYNQNTVQLIKNTSNHDDYQGYYLHVKDELCDIVHQNLSKKLSFEPMKQPLTKTNHSVKAIKPVVDKNLTIQKSLDNDKSKDKPSKKLEPRKDVKKNSEKDASAEINQTVIPAISNTIKSISKMESNAIEFAAMCVYLAPSLEMSSSLLGMKVRELKDNFSRYTENIKWIPKTSLFNFFNIEPNPMVDVGGKKFRLKRDKEIGFNKISLVQCMDFDEKKGVKVENSLYKFCLDLKLNTNPVVDGSHDRDVVLVQSTPPNFKITANFSMMIKKLYEKQIDSSLAKNRENIRSKLQSIIDTCLPGEFEVVINMP